MEMEYFPFLFQILLGLEALRREEITGHRLTQKSAYIPGKKDAMAGLWQERLGGGRGQVG